MADFLRIYVSFKIDISVFLFLPRLSITFTHVLFKFACVRDRDLIFNFKYFSLYLNYFAQFHIICINSQKCIKETIFFVDKYV